MSTALQKAVMAEHGSDYTRGDMDIAAHEASFHAFVLMSKWGSLTIASLLLMLVLLLRNILKLYADQSSSALGARLRTRMVLGAALIALTPAVFMFLFSFNLMNRSIDRWFSPNTSELREDSTRVVLELAKVEAERFAQRPDPAMAAEEIAAVWERLKAQWQRRYGLVEA